MSDALAVLALLLPVLVAAGLSVHALRLRRRAQRLEADLTAARLARAEQTVAAIRAEHAQQLGRHLHDDLGHRLTLAAIETAALRTRVTGDVADGLEQLRTDLADCVDALNRSVHGLTTPDEDGSLADRLDVVAADLTRAGIDVRMTCAVDEPPATVAETVLALVREGCTNAVRHAPGADLAVAVREEGGHVVASVVNGPPGPSATPARAGTGRGLPGLRERVEDLGGTLEAAPHDGGWSLRARVPMRDITDGDVLADRRRRARRRLVVAPIVVAVLVAAVPVGLVLGQAALSRIETSEFAAIRVGDDEASARSHLPLLGMEAPPPQVGAGECRHHEATFSPFDRTEVYEVCFADGRVSSTTIIPAP